MARTLAELRDTTTEDLFAGIYDNLMKNDGFTSILVANAGLTDKPQLKWNRLLVNPAAVVADCSTTLSSTAISAGPVTADAFTLVRQFDVCSIGAGLYSSITDTVADELQGAIKAISEKLANDAIQGDGSATMASLESYTTNSFAIAGASLDLADIDKLKDEVLTAGRKVMVGHPAAIRALRREIRENSQGNSFVELAGRQFSAYDGIPFVASQFVDSGKIHMVDLDEGYQVFFGNTYDPTLNIAGVFALEDLGPAKTKLAKEWRTYCHVFGVSKKSQGLAVLTGVA
jgi:hypothetical protein